MQPSGAVIKGEAPRTLTAGRRIVRHEVFHASLEAETILADARAAADKIRAEAWQAGYAEGLAQWNEVVAGGLRAREEYFASSEDDLLRLAVRIAEKIIGEQLRQEPGTIAAIVREALKSAPRGQRLQLHVNPAEADAVVARFADVEVIGDGAVATGGCIVVSPLGRVDAQLETQLRCMERMLTQARK